MASRAEPFITESLEAVRQRPGMYIGGTGIDGLHHLGFEVIGNSIDQVLLLRATSISVELSDGWLTVEDNGAGISIETVAGGLTFLESVFTSLHQSPTRDGPRPHVHVTAGLTGVGLGPVSALCQRVEVESHREGLCHRAAFSRGAVREAVTLVGPTQQQGLRVKLFPDPEIFEAAAFEMGRLETAIRRFASLTPEVSWRFQHHDVSKPDGLVSFLIDTANGTLEPGSIGVFEGEVADVEIAFAVALTTRVRPAQVPAITSWVNLSSTEEGGSHVRGMLAGLNDALGAQWKVLEPRVVAALHLVLAHPRFEGPTKARLAVPMTEALVRDFVADRMSAPSDLRVTWTQLAHAQR